MEKNMSTSIKIAIVVVAVIIVAAVVYFMQMGADTYNQNLGGNATNTTQKPLTVAEQKDLLNELAKPVSTDVKIINQDEQVKLLEQLAQPTQPSEDRAIGASGAAVEMPKAEPFSIDEQMKLLEQLKAQ